MLTSYSFNHRWDKKCLENQAQERRESKQTTELTAMFATDMHVIWLGGFLFYRWQHCGYNTIRCTPRKHAVDPS